MSVGPPPLPALPSDLRQVSRDDRKRRFCFTLWDLSLLAHLSDPAVRERLHIRMYFYQRERTPSSNRLHAQGYIEFAASTRFSALTSLFPSGSCRWSTAFGSRESNLVYCTKEDTREPGFEPVYWPSEEACRASDTGRPSASARGARSRDATTRREGQGQLTEAVELVQANRFTDVPTSLPRAFVIHHRGLAALDRALNPPQPRDGSTPFALYVIYGPPGIGKTYGLYNFLPYLSVPCYNFSGLTNGSLWLDNYRGERFMAIPDFFGVESLPCNQFIQWFDRYPCKVNVKGEPLTELRVNCVVLCTNVKPCEWYPNALNVHKAAVARRITATLDLFAKQAEGPLPPPPALANAISEWLAVQVRGSHPEFLVRPGEDPQSTRDRHAAENANAHEVDPSVPVVPEDYFVDDAPLANSHSPSPPPPSPAVAGPAQSPTPPARHKADSPVPVLDSGDDEPEVVEPPRQRRRLILSPPSSPYRDPSASLFSDDE